MKTDLAIYKELGNPLIVGTDQKVAVAISGFTRCPLDQVPAVLLTCMLEGISLKEYARTYHNMMGQSVMKASAMIANFRTQFGGSHKVVESTPLVGHVQLTNKEGETYDSIVLAEDAMQSRWPWNDWRAAHAKLATLAKDIAWDDKFKAMQPMMKDNWSTPRDWETMLWWRCVSTAVDRFCPEVDSGTASASDMDSLEVVSTKVTTNAKPKKSAKEAMAEKALAPPTAPVKTDPVEEVVEDAEFTAAEEDAPFDDGGLGSGFATPALCTRLLALRESLASVMSSEQWDAALAKRGAKTVHNLTLDAANELILKLTEKVKQVEAAAKADKF